MDSVFSVSISRGSLIGTLEAGSTRTLVTALLVVIGLGIDIEYTSVDGRSRFHVEFDLKGSMELSAAGSDLKLDFQEHLRNQKEVEAFTPLAAEEQQRLCRDAERRRHELGLSRDRSDVRGRCRPQPATRSSAINSLLSSTKRDARFATAALAQGQKPLALQPTPSRDL